MNLTGKEIVEQLARGATRDDVRGNVRQATKPGGKAEMNCDYANVAKYAEQIRDVPTARGIVHTAEFADRTKVSARSFSLGGRPSIQVNDPSSSLIVKVRYGK